MTAGAVILPKDVQILYLNDSKKLSPKKREELAKEMKRIKFRELKVPYVANAVAEKETDAHKIPGLFVTGVSSPVKWQQSMELMVKEGVDLFLEIGPGKTLSGFMKKIAPEAKVLSLSTWTDLEQLQKEL